MNSIQRKPPGNHWIFHRPIVGWLARPELRRQLPWPCRAFAVYAWLASRVSSTSSIPGGPSVHRLAMRLLPASAKAHPIDLGDGRRVWLNLADPRSLNVVRVLLWTTPPPSLATRLAPGDTFVDIGANHGEFSLAAARLVGPEGFIIAVEAQPDLARALALTLEHALPGRHSLHAVAVGEENGEIDLHVPRSNSGEAGVLATFSATSSHRTVRVPLRSFDSLPIPSTLPGRVFVKLDIEGSEPAFLRGSRAFFLRHRPRLMMEINPRSLQAAAIDPPRLISLLRELGYDAFEQNDTPHPMPIESLSFDSQRDIYLSPPSPPPVSDSTNRA